MGIFYHIKYPTGCKKEICLFSTKRNHVFFWKKKNVAWDGRGSSNRDITNSTRNSSTSPSTPRLHLPRSQQVKNDRWKMGEWRKNSTHGNLLSGHLPPIKQRDTLSIRSVPKLFFSVHHGQNMSKPPTEFIQSTALQYQPHVEAA